MRYPLVEGGCRVPPADGLRLENPLTTSPTYPRPSSARPRQPIDGPVLRFTFDDGDEMDAIVAGTVGLDGDYSEDGLVDYAVFPLEPSIAVAADRSVREQRLAVDPSWTRTIIGPDERQPFGFVGAAWADQSGRIRLLVSVTADNGQWYGDGYERCVDPP
jgi:hypothetical protein